MTSNYICCHFVILNDIKLCCHFALSMHVKLITEEFILGSRKTRNRPQSVKHTAKASKESAESISFWRLLLAQISPVLLAMPTRYVVALASGGYHVFFPRGYVRLTSIVLMLIQKSMGMIPPYLYFFPSRM